MLKKILLLVGFCAIALESGFAIQPLNEVDLVAKYKNKIIVTQAQYTQLTNDMIALATDRSFGNKPDVAFNAEVLPTSYIYPPSGFTWLDDKITKSSTVKEYFPVTFFKGTLAAGEVAYASLKYTFTLLAYKDLGTAACTFRK